MNTSSMKNIVILKDLPSNLVEEAIIFLKENQKLKKLEPVDIDQNSTANGKIGKISESKKDSSQYVINEANMLIAEYISKLENKNKKESYSYKRLNKKYKIAKKVIIGLSITQIASIILLFLI